MKKIINPCTCEVWTRTGQSKLDTNTFCEINYNEENGILSIHGVIGPLKSGNCRGLCGQCVDEIRKGTPTKLWTKEMLKKFCDIWDQYHLNNTVSYCQHQKKLGWMEHLHEKVKIETWTLTKEAMKMKKLAEDRAIECLRKGVPFYPTKDEIAYARMQHSIKVYNGENISYKYGKLYRDAYELEEENCLGYPKTEYYERGRISYKTHPLGFLGRPCPVCGYEYGTKWFKEDIPQDVIDFLKSLPDTEIQPAWI